MKLDGEVEHGQKKNPFDSGRSSFFKNWEMGHWQGMCSSSVILISKIKVLVKKLDPVTLFVSFFFLHYIATVVVVDVDDDDNKE